METMLDSLNAGPDEDLRLVLQSARDFAQQRLFPLAHELDRLDRFPRELWPELGEMGLLGITVPEEDGGSGFGYLAHCLVMEELSAAAGGVALSYGAHSNLCVNQIRRNGRLEQKARYLPRLISGEHVGAPAMSEPEAGSDVVSMRLKASAVEGGYRLNGRKMWITNCDEADVLVVYAKTEPDAGSKGITAFLVEREFEGFSVAQKLDKLGMRGSPTGELVFEDCFVPKENVLGELNRGVAVLMSGLDYERVVLAAGPLGLMRAALELVLPYVRERKQFGQAIGEFQLIQGKLADLYSSYQSCRSYLHAVARACDRGDADRKDAASVILVTAEAATRAALDAIQIMGGIGYTNDCIAGRILRDAKLYEIGAGTSEIRRMLIGRELFAGR